MVITINHILDRLPFESNILSNVADVNNSGSVSSTDVVIIKNIILRRIDGFEGRTPWNFDPPILRSNVPSNTITIRAFKLGDVNSSASRE